MNENEIRTALAGVQQIQDRIKNVAEAFSVEWSMSNQEIAGFAYHGRETLEIKTLKHDWDDGTLESFDMPIHYLWSEDYCLDMENDHKEEDRLNQLAEESKRETLRLAMLEKERLEYLRLKAKYEA